MKKVLVRLERALVRAALRPELRPLEHDAAVALARSVARRWGLSASVVAIAVELIDRYAA